MKLRLFGLIIVLVLLTICMIMALLREIQGQSTAAIVNLLWAILLQQISSEQGRSLSRMIKPTLR